MNGLYVLTTNDKKNLLDYVMNNEMDIIMKNKIIELIVSIKEKEKLPRIDNVYRLSEVLERYRNKEKKPITIQELQQEINTLKIEIKTLRKENETLDFRLTKLEQNKDNKVEELNEKLKKGETNHESPNQPINFYKQWI